MGIRTKIEGDFTAIKLASMADDMLAEVVAKHAEQRFRPSNRANAAMAGQYVPYTVELNGRTVSRGSGELFAERQLALAIYNPARPPARVARLPAITIEWAWDKLNPSALEHALKTLTRIDRTLDTVTDAAAFARMLAAGDRLGLLRVLLTAYARARYPEVFARLDQARALYRVFRLLHAGAGLIGGSRSEGDADPSVLAWIAKELRSRSPVLSGEYRDAHELYADGSPLMNAAELTQDAKLPAAEEFSFTNTVPYARKIEFGKTQAGRDFVIQVPNRVYERVAQDARQRFRGLAEIAFEMRAVIGAEQTPQRRATRPHNKPAVRFPSIVVRF